MAAARRKDLSKVYGPLGPGPRLKTDHAEAVGAALCSYYADLTKASARILAQHLYRLSLANPKMPAADAIYAIGEDLGLGGSEDAIEMGEGGAMLGGALLGGGLGDWLRSIGRKIKGAVQAAAPHAQAAFAAVAPGLADVAKKHAGMAISRVLAGEKPSLEGLKAAAVDAAREGAQGAVADLQAHLEGGGSLEEYAAGLMGGALLGGGDGGDDAGFAGALLGGKAMRSSSRAISKSRKSAARM